MNDSRQNLSRNPADSGPAPKLPSPSPSRMGSARKPTRVVIRTAANRFGFEGELTPPDGMDYGWKVMSVLGKPATEDMTNWRLNGWTPVPAGRHPEFTGTSPDSQEEIVRGGLCLCERPVEITEQSRQMDRQAAVDQVNTQLERLQLRARDTQSQRVTKLNRVVEAITDDV